MSFRPQQSSRPNISFIIFCKKEVFFNGSCCRWRIRQRICLRSGLVHSLGHYPSDRKLLLIHPAAGVGQRLFPFFEPGIGLGKMDDWPGAYTHQFISFGAYCVSSSARRRETYGICRRRIFWENERFCFGPLYFAGHCFADLFLIGEDRLRAFPRRGSRAGECLFRGMESMHHMPSAE